MPETVKLFRLMGKTPTVLVDADGFADGLNLINAYFSDEEIRNIADTLASKQGMDGILKVTNDIYNKFCTLVDKKLG